MKKKSLIVKKLSLDNEKIMNSDMTLDVSSITFILSDRERSHLFFKSLLNLIDSNKKATLFTTPISESLNNIGYYSETFDIYKDMKVKEFFKYSNSFYKNFYLDNAIRLLNKFNIGLNVKIKDLSKEDYEMLKIIEALYHKPELLILEYPFENIDTSNFEGLENELLSLKNDGSTILISSDRVDILYSLDNHYYIFDDAVITNLKLIKNKLLILVVEGELNLKMKILRTEKLENESRLIYPGEPGLLLDELSKAFVRIKEIKVGDLL